jgi:hypothetical protein
LTIPEGQEPNTLMKSFDGGNTYTAIHFKNEKYLLINDKKRIRSLFN